MARQPFFEEWPKLERQYNERKKGLRAPDEVKMNWGDPQKLLKDNDERDDCPYEKDINVLIDIRPLNSWFVANFG